MLPFIKTALQTHYNLTAHAVKKVPGGWSADAFLVRTDRGDYFAKVYDKHRPSTKHWIDRMSLYMPTVLWLSNSTPMGDKMNAPVLTQSGTYKVENGNFALLLFPYIEGETIAESPLTPTQITLLANTLAELHSYTENEIPTNTESLRETYALPFLNNLNTALTEQNTALRPLLNEHQRTVQQSVMILQTLAETMRQNPPGHVLCHTDVHGWNIMQSTDGRLILVDWEGLQLAPAEAELFSFTGGFFFAGAGDAFFKSYQAARPAYKPSPTAMQFYRLRRRVEDISEFCHSILNDSLAPEEQQESFIHLAKECRALAKM